MSNEQHPNPWSREGWSTSGTPRESAPQHWSASASGNEPTLPLNNLNNPQAAQTGAQPTYPQQPQQPTQQQPQLGYQQVGPFGPTATATKPRAKGRKRVAGVVALALLAVGAGGGAGFAATQLAGGGSSASGVTTQVVQADASNPNWTTVAAAASKAVAAIDVTSSSGEAQGSGVVIDAAGYIVTNNHVVSGMSNATITVLLDNVSYSATVVGTDPSTDLAVIKLDNPPSNLSVMAYGDNTALQVGDQVMAIGNPLGLADTVTTGIVSALNRPVTTEAVSSDDSSSSQSQTAPSAGQGGPFGGWQQQEQQQTTAAQSSSDTVVTAAIQTNAAINPGNSGGALVNTSGQLVGITSSIATLSSSSSSSESSSGNIGIGFAIGSDQVKYVVDQLIANGTAQHPQLGVTATDVSGTGQQGAQIVSVTEGSGAASAGLQAGDVVTAVNGNPVASTESLVALVRAGQVGKAMTLTVVRNGTEQEVSVTPTAAAQ